MPIESAHRAFALARRSGLLLTGTEMAAISTDRHTPRVRCRHARMAGCRSYAPYERWVSGSTPARRGSDRARSSNAEYATPDGAPIAAERVRNLERATVLVRLPRRWDAG